jgi:hypothetical protein
MLHSGSSIAGRLARTCTPVSCSDPAGQPELLDEFDCRDRAVTSRSIRGTAGISMD